MARAAGRRAAPAVARVGDALAAVGTPALVLDLDVFEANCRALVETMRQFEGRGPGGGNVTLRPHAKAHKSSALARRQLELLGPAAVGLGCQTLAEAEAMVWGGLKDVTITNEVVPADKVQRLAELAQTPDVSLGVCVDSAANARALSAALTGCGASIKVLVECNVGQNRCGVETAEEAVALAQLVAELPGLDFDGYQAYHGAIQHVRGFEDRRAECQKVADKVVALNKAFADAGLTCRTVTGGGTGTFLFDAGSGLYTEVQPGSYFFGDADYGRNDWSAAKAWRQSLLIAATVISQNPARRTVVLDSGLKAVDLGSGVPLVLGHEETWTFANGGDEHGVVSVPEPAPLPEVGDKLYLIPGHIDPTFNMHRCVVCVRNDVVEDVLEIDASGPGF